MKRLLFILILLPCVVAWGQTRTVVDVSHDTYIDYANDPADLGGADSLRVYYGFSDMMRALIAFSKGGLYDTIGTNATASTCTLAIYCWNTATGVTINLRKACKPFESNADYSTWDGTKNWQNAGADHVAGSNCEDCYNTGDGTGDDYANPSTSVAIASNDDDTWIFIPVDTCHINDWIAKRDTICGVRLGANGMMTGATFRSANHANAPYLIINWTAPADEGPPNALRTPDGPGLLRSPNGGSKRRGP